MSKWARPDLVCLKLTVPALYQSSSRVLRRNCISWQCLIHSGSLLAFRSPWRPSTSTSSSRLTATEFTNTCKDAKLSVSPSAMERLFSSSAFKSLLW
jgi:hypothetical protein